MELNDNIKQSQSVEGGYQLTPSLLLSLALDLINRGER